MQTAFASHGDDKHSSTSSWHLSPASIRYQVSHHKRYLRVIILWLLSTNRIINPIIRFTKLSVGFLMVLQISFIRGYQHFTLILRRTAAVVRWNSRWRAIILALTTVFTWVTSAGWYILFTIDTNIIVWTATAVREPIGTCKACGIILTRSTQTQVDHYKNKYFLKYSSGIPSFSV